MKDSLRHIQEELESRGYSPEVRAAIRNSKVCIIDDRLEDLRSLTQGLRAEGFTNLVELQRISSIEEILKAGYDLVILDLSGVAQKISATDGFGALDHLKTKNPGLPVLVVTGTTTPPDRVSVLNKADSIRSKPVKTLELVSDVEQLLRPYKDPNWAALEILRDLRRLHPDIQNELPWSNRALLWYHRKRLWKKLATNDADLLPSLIKVSKLLIDLGSAAIKIREMVAKVGIAE